jgi:hypothetical protein
LLTEGAGQQRDRFESVTLAVGIPPKEASFGESPCCILFCFWPQKSLKSSFSSGSLAVYSW